MELAAKVRKRHDLVGRCCPGCLLGVASTEEKCAAVGAEYGLTPREGEVFALLAQGRTVGVIREKLVIR